MGLLKVSSFSYLSIAPFFSKSKLNSFLKQMDMAWNNWGDYKKKQCFWIFWRLENLGTPAISFTKNSSKYQLQISPGGSKTKAATAASQAICIDRSFGRKPIIIAINPAA